jgi:Flp pilus assembly CpaE family ATPase
VIVFSSTKPGSGASTLAAYTAFALHEVTGQRILLADFALWSGTLRLLFKLPDSPSLADVLRALDADNLDTSPESWAALITHKSGVDLLPSPAAPLAGEGDASRLRKVLEYARPAYDWILVDLPTVFERLSLLMVPEADQAFLVSTPELPSLHLTRKAVSLLGLVGLTTDNFHVLVNRVTKADTLALEAMAKIFKAPVYASFPNDYLSLHKALSAGQPLGSCALERALTQFAHTICSQPRAGALRASSPVIEKAI